MTFSRNGVAAGFFRLLAIGLLAVFCSDFETLGLDIATNRPAAPAKTKALADALSPAKWKEVESAVDRALARIASQQLPDGSFPTLPSAHPAVTSLCVMAFLSRGHQPGTGPYGQQLNRAIDFVISCQRPDGLFSYAEPGPYH